jgi:Ca2+-binding EF-hand superfamily protein
MVAPQVWARSAGTERTLKAVDTDNDGSVDLNEAKAAAEATFDRLEKDKDGTVTQRNCRAASAAKT